MANQKNTPQDSRRPQASPKRKPQAGSQQQAYSPQSGQQGDGVERANRSLADRERDEADRGAPDDLLPDRQPPGWTTRDV